MLPTLLLFTTTVTSSVFISQRDTGASTWDSIKASYEASAQELWDPVKGPTYKDVVQDNPASDCWFEASMAAIANADKNRIKISMVDPKNDKGTVPVTLYNGSTSGTYEITKHTITSPDPFEYSDAAAEVTGGRHVWPSAMEDGFIAYAKAVPLSLISMKLENGNST